MPRIARAVAVGVPYHITQRGNHRQDIFFSSEDRQVYLQWLAEEESCCWHAIRYVERNPLRAKLVERAEDYPWSSAAAHCGLVTVPVLSPITIDHMLTTAGWSDWLAGDDGDEMLSLRAATASGNACGGSDFVECLSTIIGRPLQVKPRGRPKNRVPEAIGIK